MSKFIWKIQSSFYHRLRRNPLSARILQNENKGIKAFFNEITAWHILDIGCGRGNNLRLLSEYTTSVVITDYVLNMLKNVKHDFPLATTVMADACWLPFKDGSFDLITCIGVLEYIKDWQLVLQEVHRLLIPGGQAIITLSPPHLFNYGRWLLGHRIFTRNMTDLYNLLGYTSLQIVSQNRTLIQNQFLLKKL